MVARRVREKRGIAKWLLCGLILLLVACAPMKKSELRTLRPDELCLEYARDNINQPNVRAVLTEEGMVRDRYWDHIDRKTLSTGMNECETLAVYGKPDETKTIISILGRREKWIWRSPLNGSNAEPKHAYFRDGIVTSLGKFR